MRKGAREQEAQEVQQGSVLDAVGAAARGDRPVPALHEEASENIRNRNSDNSRNVKSEMWARLIKEAGGGHPLRPHLYTCWYKVCERRGGGDDRR